MKNQPPPIKPVQVVSSVGPGGAHITITVGQKTDEYGLVSVTVEAGTPLASLPPVREPLDSQIYFVSIVDEAGNYIGDSSNNMPILSVLIWQPFTAPSNPTWADVGAILEAYSRLYPGMRDKLDIGNETTVKGFAQIMHNRMSLPMIDPAYMPVTRDLISTKMEMIVGWLKTFLPNSDSDIA